MSFVTRCVGTLALSLGFTVACGGGDSGSFGGSSGGSRSAGGSENDASAGGKGTGGRSGSGGKATGGSTAGTTGTGGDGGDASSAGGGAGDSGAAGGTDSGAAGAGGAAAGAGGVAAGGATTGGRGGTGGTGGKKANGQVCTAGTECTSGNCVGGTCCGVACNTPGPCQKLAGTVCLNGDTCQYGLLADKTTCDTGDKCAISSCFDGECHVDASKNCSDGNPCTDDLCNSATGACTHPATNCDDKNPCTSDTCGASGCTHTDNDTGCTANPAACTDNNPCTTDVCSGGVLRHNVKDCSGSDDDCNKGVCSGGNCQKQPANSGAACTMGLTACDTAGACNASGACVGDLDGCGPLSASCATCSTGANCHAGRDCTCATANPPNVVSSAGICVPNTDECAVVPGPCASIATCRDPSAAAGDVVCTCPKGYTGNGKGTSGCADVNECSPTNSCGSGGTCTNTPGSYTCACAVGFKSITTATGPKCVCDLSGTYGLVVTSNVTWTSPNPAIEASPAGGVPIYSWTLRYNTVAADGTMTSTTIPCGGTSPTLCDTAFSFAHAQYQPDATWGQKKVNDGFPPFKMSLAGVVPGAASGAYSEPQTASLQGISLDDPAAAWPACAACVGVDVGGTCTCNDGTHTVTNKATWVDADSDTHLGFTTETVPRGGQAIGSPYIIDSSVADPPFDYTEPSECPRSTSGSKYNYAEFPGLVGLLPFRAYRWYAASRIISKYSSTSITLSNNQCVIAGNVGGPDSGKPHSDARVQGCEICDPAAANSCNPGGPCSPEQISSYDELSQTQSFVSTTFTMKNVTSTINLAPIIALPDGPSKESQLSQACQELRVQDCPSGKTCQ